MLKIFSNRYFLSTVIIALILIGLASLPSAGAGNGKGSAPGTAKTNNAVVKVVPVYVSPPKITVPPSAVTVAPLDPSLWDRVWTVILTFATISQAVVAGFLLNAARRQANAANKQVLAAEAQANAAKEQILVSREQIEASREQIKEARLLRLTSERPTLSLQIFDDASQLDNRQHPVNEESGVVSLATHTTIVANNHGNAPSFDTDIKVLIKGNINGMGKEWSTVLHFNVVPANANVSVRTPIFSPANYDPGRLGFDTADTLEVELSATYRNTQNTFFEVLGCWTVQPFIITTSLTLSDGTGVVVRSSRWDRFKNEDVFMKS